MKEKLERHYFSDDGNKQKRDEWLDFVTQWSEGVDQLKDKEKATLGDLDTGVRGKDKVPQIGYQMDDVTNELLRLTEGENISNARFSSNVVPMSSHAGVLGMLAMAETNGNALWDAHGVLAGRTEQAVVKMLSEEVGYDPEKAGGYTTWGGQGAVFTGLRAAIQRKYPKASEEGVPRNLYAFASEYAHYSLYKSMQAVGIGTNHLIKVKTNDDMTMDVEDLKAKMVDVLEAGGIPIYVVGTVGTTDQFAMDSVKDIKNGLADVEEAYEMDSIYVHADTAMGGLSIFLKDYDTETNSLQFKEMTLRAVESIQEKISEIHLADSVCFDFHKLGQTPYATSLFMVKDHQTLGLLDLEKEETPYVGDRAYGEYHTSYTLECSRQGSSVPIYAALMAFGKEGYQLVLGSLIENNMMFREKLVNTFGDGVEILNDQNMGMVTLFRFCPDDIRNEDWNEYNELLFEVFGSHREEMFLGDTTRAKIVDGERVSGLKYFSISPFTEEKDIEAYMEFLEEGVKEKALV